MDQATPEKPSWRARLGAAWQAVKTKAATWWAFTGPKGLIPLLPAAVGGGLLGWVLCQVVQSPAPGATPPLSVEAPPGLQDQIDALRLRVIVLEARADAPPKPVAAPRATAPRAGASTPVAPGPDQFADTSELVEPPTPRAPITRQSVDQFRASLRTPQPVQE
jgi:hypothetical protein